MSPLWELARVAEPSGLDETEHNGTVIMNVEQLTVLSLNPAEDFEINTNVVQGWKIMFVDDEHVIGSLDYKTALAKLKPYQIDEQAGSILIDALSREEIENLL